MSASSRDIRADRISDTIGSSSQMAPTPSEIKTPNRSSTSDTLCRGV